MPEQTDDVLDADPTPFTSGLIAAYSEREGAERLVAALAKNHVEAWITESIPAGEAWGVCCKVQVPDA